MLAEPTPITRAELGKRSLNEITQDLVSSLVNAENPEKAIKNLNDFKKMKLIPEHIYNSIIDQASIEDKGEMRSEVRSQQDVSYLALELFMASLKEKENDIQDVNAPFADFMIEVIETLNLLIDDATNATPVVVMLALVFASAGVIKASVASSVLKAFFSHVFHTQDVSAVNSFLKTGLAFDNLIAKNVMGEKLQTLAQSHDYFNLLCAEFLAWKAITVPTEKLLVSNLMDHLGPIQKSNPEMYSAYIALFATFYAAGAGLGTTAFVNFAAGLDSSPVYYMPAYQLIGLLDTEAETALLSGTIGANALVLAFVSLKGALGFSLGLQSNQAKKANNEESYNAFENLFNKFKGTRDIDRDSLNAFNQLNQFDVDKTKLQEVFDKVVKDNASKSIGIDTTDPTIISTPSASSSSSSGEDQQDTTGSFLAQFTDTISKKTPADILKESEIDFEKDPKIIAFAILKSKLGIANSDELTNSIKVSYEYFEQLMDPSKFSGPDQTTDFHLDYNDVKAKFIQSNIIKLNDEQLKGAIEFVKNPKMPKRIDELPLSIKIRVLLSKTLFPLFDLTLSVITPALLVLNVVTRFIFTLFTGCNVLTNEPIASIGSFLHKFSLNTELAKQKAIRYNVTNLLYFHEGDLNLLNQKLICDDSIETLKSDIKLNKQSSLFSLMSLSGIEKPPASSEIISAIANSQIVEYFVSFPVGLANFSKGFVGLKTELLEQYTRDLITAEEKFYNDNNNNGAGLVIDNEDSLDDILNKYRSANAIIRKRDSMNRKANAIIRKIGSMKGLYDTNIRDAHKKHMPINLQTLNTLVFLPILLPLRLLTVTAILIRMAFVGFDNFSRYYLQSAKERTNDDVVGLLRALTIVVKFNLIFAPKWFMDRLTTPYRFAKRRAVAKGEIEKFGDSILVKEHLSSNLSLPAHKMLRVARKMEADIKDYYKIKYILVDKETGLPIKNNGDALKTDAEPRMNILTNTKHLLAACCTIENYVNVTINASEELDQIIKELLTSINTIDEICSITQLHDTKRKLSGIKRVLKELQDLMPTDGNEIPPGNIDKINEILAVSRTSLQGGRTLAQELNNLMSVAINEAYNVSYAHVPLTKGAQYLVANTSKYQYQEMLNELTKDSYRMKDIYDKRRFEKKIFPGEPPMQPSEDEQHGHSETAEASAEKTSNTANLLNFIRMSFAFAIVGYTASIITNILKKIVVSVMGITPFDGKTIAKVDKMFSDMESNLNFKDLDATRFLETNYLDSIGNTSVSNRKRLGIDDSKEEFMQLIRHAKHEDVTQEATGGQEDYYKKTQTIKHLTFTAAEISEMKVGIGVVLKTRNQPVEHPLLKLVEQHTALANLCTSEEHGKCEENGPSSNL